jgi:putative transposase
MPKNLKRYYGRGDLHFVTFSCYRRIPLLRTIGARNVFVKALGAIRDRYKFSLVGYSLLTGLIPDRYGSLTKSMSSVRPR